MGYCYFILAPELSRFKIGKARGLKSRFSSLSTASLCDLELYGYIESKDYEKIEKIAHKEFNHKRVRNEWFDITANDADDFLSRHNGKRYLGDQKCAISEDDRYVYLSFLSIENLTRNFVFAVVSLLGFVLYEFKLVSLGTSLAIFQTSGSVVLLIIAHFIVRLIWKKVFNRDSRQP